MPYNHCHVISEPTNGNCWHTRKVEKYCYKVYPVARWCWEFHKILIYLTAENHHRMKKQYLMPKHKLHYVNLYTIWECVEGHTHEKRNPVSKTTYWPRAFSELPFILLALHPVFTPSFHIRRYYRGQQWPLSLKWID